MEKIYRHKDFEISVRHQELTRLLGYGRNQVPDRVQKLIAEVEKTAAPLISTACAYRRMKRAEFAHSPYLYHVDKLVLGVVTIGSRLEAAAEKLRDEGDLARALVMDAYGSAAAEAAAEATQSIIETEMRQEGLYTSHRFSPGYACWNVTEQTWILPVLKSEELGVTLTEGRMMVPRKSITFAMTYGDSPMESRHEHSCEVCGMVDCRFESPC